MSRVYFAADLHIGHKNIANFRTQFSSAEERKYYFENPDKIVGEYVKFKMFPKGVKDEPRFPVYTMTRPKEDVVL